MEERGWTVSEFAEIIGRPVQAVSEILNGKKEITTETAPFAFAMRWVRPRPSGSTFEHPTTGYSRQRTRKHPPETMTPVAATRPPAKPGASRRGTRAGLAAEHRRSRHRSRRQYVRFLDVDSLDERPRSRLRLDVRTRRSPSRSSRAAWLAHIRTVAAARTVPTFDSTKLASLSLRTPAGNPRRAEQADRAPAPPSPNAA